MFQLQLLFASFSIHVFSDPDNTQTPLIAWGKGIRGPLPDSNPSSHDDYSAPWDLTRLLRRDVEQADVAALMSTLIGIDWPVNSVGVVPDVDHTRPGYLLDVDGGKTQAEAALVNARVLLSHYRVKHGQFHFFPLHWAANYCMLQRGKENILCSTSHILIFLTVKHTFPGK